MFLVEQQDLLERKSKDGAELLLYAGAFQLGRRRVDGLRDLLSAQRSFELHWQVPLRVRPLPFVIYYYNIIITV